MRMKIPEAKAKTAKTTAGIAKEGIRAANPIRIR